MNSMLKWVVMGGIFLLPLSVLVVADSLFFPFITGKAFFYRIVVEVVFAAWVLLALSRTEYRPHKQKIYYVLFALLGILFVSNMVSDSPYKAFWSNFERMDGFIALIHHAMFFVVISSVLTTHKLWGKFWNVSLGVSVVVCFYGLLQRLGVMEAIQGSGARVDGTFGNAAYLAVYNLFHVFLAVWLLYKSKPKGVRMLYGVIGLFNLMNLYWTATRGVFVGLVVGIFVSLVIVLVKDKEHKRLRQISGGVLVFVTVVVGSIFALKDSSFIANNPTLARFSTISLTEGQTRFTVWSMALKGVAEKPIIGWGQEGFSSVFAKHYEPSMYNQEPWFDRAHNIVIDWLIAGGVLGLLLYMSLLGFGVRYIWQSEWFDTFEKALFTGLYVGYFAQNLFVFDNLGSYMLFFATLAFFTVGARRDTDAWFAQSVASASSIRLAQPLVAVLLILVVYSANIKPLRAGQEFITAYIPNQTPERIAEAFERALSRNTFADYEVTEQMMVRGPDFLRNQNVSEELKQTYFTILQGSLAKVEKRNNQNARFNYATGVFYNNIGQSDKAREYLTKAHELSPKKQIISFELAFSYIGTGEKEMGMALLKETLDDTPEFQEARKMYALGAIYTGDRALEDELLESLPEEAVAQDPRFISAYTNAKRIDEVIRLLQGRVESNPTNIQAYVSLAAAYVEAGNRSRAIEVLQQAIEIEPRFKEQGEKFINDIREGRL